MTQIQLEAAPPVPAKKPNKVAPKHNITRDISPHSVTEWQLKYPEAFVIYNQYVRRWEQEIVNQGITLSEEEISVIMESALRDFMRRVFQPKESPGSKVSKEIIDQLPLPKHPDDLTTKTPNSQLTPDWPLNTLWWQRVHKQTIQRRGGGQEDV